MMEFNELMALWQAVNDAADAEDAVKIRELIASAGVQPNVHVGVDPADFSPRMVAEWVLGQWADMIDNGSPWLNTARSVSHDQFAKLCVSTGWPQ